LNELPKHFTPFRKRVEKTDLPAVSATPQRWPDSQRLCIDRWSELSAHASVEGSQFKGGETAGLAHLNQYMDSDLPSSYKKVRNELMGWSHSTKFSPWLAWGCISPRQIMQQLHQYETERGANESTYWIFFELLWREFFHWNGLKQGSRLFHSKGSDVATSKTPKACEKFIDWSEGHTGVPLIDACMRQLNQSGYMSNRGRQIAASYLINDAGVDWRLGAAYFEQQLIDYDVASNWGNWQYIAGVGADPRGGRHFNIEKQQKTHDPKDHFVKRWAEYDVTLQSVRPSDVLS
jgi:deoxyribodipyrimidine photo-lyase